VALLEAVMRVCAGELGFGEFVRDVPAHLRGRGASDDHRVAAKGAEWCMCMVHVSDVQCICMRRVGDPMHGFLKQAPAALRASAGTGVERRCHNRPCLH